MISIDNVLDSTNRNAIFDFIASRKDKFLSGEKTAGWHAREVKQNEQLDEKSAATITAKISATLLANPVFAAAARPKTFVKIMVSRYRPGMEYGLHVDDALMSGVRTDLSFTLFLSDPATYEGGELVIEGNDGMQEIKLPPGSLILYPTTTLHRVAPVKKGERIAIVGWVRSFIRNHEQREILFDLDNAIAMARADNAGRETIDRLLKVKMNLLRQWAED
jgi:PKHD-type hydroxylase